MNKRLILSLLYIAVLIFVLVFLKNIFNLSKNLSIYRTTIEEIATEYNVDPYTVTAIICQESGFDDKAFSGVAHGLMQLTKDTALFISEKTNLAFENMFDVKTNISMGCWYLSYLEQKFKNTKTALAAYNAGPTVVSSWLLDKRYSKDCVSLYNIPYKETRHYVRKVRLFETFFRAVRLYD